MKNKKLNRYKQTFSKVKDSIYQYKNSESNQAHSFR